MVHPIITTFTRILVTFVLISPFGLIKAQSLSLPSIFYPAGPDLGDAIAPVNDDGSTPELFIGTLFPYFDQNHGSLFVSKFVSSLFLGDANNLCLLLHFLSLNSFGKKAKYVI